MEEKENNYQKTIELYQKFGEPKELLQNFYDLDYPIPYKTIKIYPIEVDLYVYFHLLVESLTLKKNESGDIKAISMSYLRYLFYIAENGKEIYLQYLKELFLMCFHLSQDTQIDFFADKNTAFFEIGGERFDDNDFEKIKSIILEQNSVEQPPKDMHPDVYKALKEAETYKQKQSNFKMCDLGNQLNVVMINSGYTKPELLKMTIRTFTSLLERINLEINYKLSTILSPNMEKKEQQKITHYLADVTANRYKDLMIDYDDYKGKIK